MINWYVKELDTGLKVASGDALDEDTANTECFHYAIQYVQDGPIEYCVKNGRKILVKGTMSRVTVKEMSDD